MIMLFFHDTRSKSATNTNNDNNTNNNTTMVADAFVARTAALQDVMVCFSARRWRAWSLEGRVRYLGWGSRV